MKHSMISVVRGRHCSLPAALVFLTMLSCGGGDGTETLKMADELRGFNGVPAETWGGVADKRIFFGHQSVGMNIIEGVGEVVAANPRIPLAVVSTEEYLGTPSGGLLAHGPVGKNRQPSSKMEEFSQRLRAMQERARLPDIALLKFCYVDIDESTDIPALFQAYREWQNRLEQEFPGVLFGHMTVPLRSDRPTLKQRIKRLLGRRGIDYLENVQRNRFNELLRAEYGGSDLLFDLALVEATRPDRSRAAFHEDGQTYLQLAEEYTDDGGHLNALGRRVVAEEFLAYLARTATGAKSTKSPGRSR